MSDNFYFYTRLRALLNGAKGKWMYIIFAKWYLLIAVPAFYTTYYFFSKLEETGIPKKIREFIAIKLNMIITISKECTLHIGELSNFYECINNIK